MTSFQHAPVREQLAEFERLVLRNDVVATLLDRLAGLRAPDWYLTAGCLTQTVWNCLAGLPPAEGIKDYDVIFCDADEPPGGPTRAAVLAANADLGVELDVHNQARRDPPMSSAEAVASWPTTASCVAARRDAPGGPLTVLAPRGLADLFGLIARSNPVRASREVYMEKTGRWKQRWPELTVLPWVAPPAPRRGRRPPRA
jgi:hypothetical protein